MKFLMVFIGGGLGSILRYAISLLINRFPHHYFPTATLIANVLSCIILGFVIHFFSQKTDWTLTKLFVMMGFCGGFSTFSTFSLETFHLLKNNLLLYAVLNIVLSIGFGVGIIYILLKNQ